MQSSFRKLLTCHSKQTPEKTNFPELSQWFDGSGTINIGNSVRFALWCIATYVIILNSSLS